MESLPQINKIKTRCLLAVLFMFIMSIPHAGAQQRAERSTGIVTIEGESYYVHTVAGGQTLYSLSKLYDVPVDDIVGVNPHIAGGLKEGHVIKIPFKNTALEGMSSRRQARLFDTHIVNAGETLYAISRRYEIPVNVLLEDNDGLDPAHLSIGQTINIRKKSVGDATPAQIDQQMEEYRDAINSVSDDYEYHLVLLGETLYSLSRRFGVTEQQLVELNNLTDGLKAGALIKVRPKGVEPEHFEAVTDSLFKVDRVTEDSVVRTTLTVKEFAPAGAVSIAMLLPLDGETGAAAGNFLEFYQGALLGVEDLKNEGIPVDLSLYNTGRSTDEVRRIVRSDDFGQPDIIIGPVYEDNMRPAVNYAQENRIVLVSPLGAVNRTESPVLFQMAPDASQKFEKLKGLFTPDRNIVYVTTVNSDPEMDENVRPMLPAGYKQIDYNATLRMKQGVFDNVLDPDGDNLVIVSCTNELVADQILAAISSFHSNLVARSQMRGNITILGGSGWSRFDSSIDKTLFFKLNVCFLSFYHADRGDEKVGEFDRRFVSAYQTLPTLYAYRGYDAVKLFGGAVRAEGDTFAARLAQNGQSLLQMPYGFFQKDPAGTFYNAEWGLVCYGNDYTITVK